MWPTAPLVEGQRRAALSLGAQPDRTPRRLQHLNDDPERVKQITQLGLDYRLLTNHTSFIAVDQRIRNPRPEDSQKVDQPLPMPLGVSDSALGANLPSRPLPSRSWWRCSVWWGHWRRGPAGVGIRSVRSDRGQSRAALLLAAQLACFWPVWTWYLHRLNDGSDEPWAIAARWPPSS